MQVYRCPGPNDLSHVAVPKRPDIRRRFQPRNAILFFPDKMRKSSLDFATSPPLYTMFFIATFSAIGCLFFIYKASAASSGPLSVGIAIVLAACCLFASAMSYLSIPVYATSSRPVTLTDVKLDGSEYEVSKWVLSRQRIRPMRRITARVISFQVCPALAHRLAMAQEFDDFLMRRTKSDCRLPSIGHIDELYGFVREWLVDGGLEANSLADFVADGFALVAWCEESAERSVGIERLSRVPILLSFSKSLKEIQQVVAVLDRELKIKDYSISSAMSCIDYSDPCNNDSIVLIEAC